MTGEELHLLRLAAGREAVRLGDAVPRVAGCRPRGVVSPQDVAAAAAVIVLARQRRWRILPAGACLALDRPRPEQHLDILIRSDRLTRLVDYQPDDMTVTVESGLTCSQLEQVLQERGQFLPINPPLPDQATVGGMVATASAGPWRAGYGTPRDWLIGCRVLDSDGLIVRGGGQVVKNVAGYDLPRLYAGSLGSLGLLTELTFKVTPRPESFGYCRAAPPDAERAEAMLAAISASDLQPAACELISDSDSLDWSMMVEFHHVQEAVEWQMDCLEAIGEATGCAVMRLDGAAGLQAMAELRDAPGLAESCIRYSLLSSQVAGFIQGLQSEAADRGLSLRLRSHALTGQVDCLGGPDVTTEIAAELQRFAADHGAWCEILRLPPGVLAPDPIRVEPALPLQRAIKAAMDPQALFAPSPAVG